MNEIIFFIHIASILLFLLGSAKLGKEALITWSCLQVIIANLFVLKQMTFLSLDITCSDMFIVGNILSLNLIQEYYGKETAKKTMWIGFFCMVFFTVMSKIHLSYIPNQYDTSQGSFYSLLSVTPRIFFASLLTFVVVQRFDIFFFGVLKKGEKKIPLIIRTVLCLILSQTFDTILFSFLGLYGVVGSVQDVIISALCIKFFVIACLSPVTTFAKRFLPKEVRA